MAVLGATGGLIFAFQNCTPFTAKLSAATDTFDMASYMQLEQSVENTFSNRCVGCHSSLAPTSNEPYLNLVYEMKFEQKFVRRGDPENSPIYQKIVQGSMPPGGPDLVSVAPEEVAAVYEWILFMP